MSGLSEALHSIAEQLHSLGDILERAEGVDAPPVLSSESTRLGAAAAGESSSTVTPPAAVYDIVCTRANGETI